MIALYIFPVSVESSLSFIRSVWQLSVQPLHKGFTSGHQQEHLITSLPVASSSISSNQQKKRRSCSSRRVRNNISSVGQVGKWTPKLPSSSPGTCGLVTRQPWQLSCSKRKVCWRSKTIQTEGREGWRLRDGRPKCQRGTLLSRRVWEALMGPSLWFSGTTWCTYRPGHGHPCVSTELPPLSPSGSRMWPAETSSMVLNVGHDCGESVSWY